VRFLRGFAKGAVRRFSHGCADNGVVVRNAARWHHGCAERRASRRKDSTDRGGISPNDEEADVKLTHEEFLELTRDWAEWWRRRQDEGEPGFEDGPRDLESWTGSIDSFHRIRNLMGAAHLDDAPPRRERVQ
jgi:hypothetical protein